MLTKTMKVMWKIVKVLCMLTAILFGVVFVGEVLTAPYYASFNAEGMRTFVIFELACTASWWSKKLWKYFWRAYAWTRVIRIKIRSYLSVMDEKIAGWRKA